MLSAIGANGNEHKHIHTYSNELYSCSAPGRVLLLSGGVDVGDLFLPLDWISIKHSSVCTPAVAATEFSFSHTAKYT